MALGWNSIISLVTYPLLAPFYIIALKKWYALRNDWIFRLRYSAESITVVLLSLTMNQISIIRSVLDDLGYLSDKESNDISAIMYTGYWIIFCTIYYRTNLVLLSFRQSQARLNSQTVSLAPRKHCSSYLLLCIVIGGAFCNLFLMLIPSALGELIIAALWFLMYLVGIIIFVVVKMKRVKELFGCMYECYILFGVIISYWLVLIFSSGHADIIRFAGYVYNHIISLFLLYYTLYFLRKHEYIKSRKPKRHSVASLVPASSVSASQSEHDMQDQQAQENGTLAEYLTNKQNYDMFSEYLAYCWCLENLMFVEKACVFYWLVMKQNSSCDGNSGGDTKHKLYSMKFGFLTEIWAEYENAINNCKNDGNAPDSNDFFEPLRDTLWSLCHNIYREYIDDNATNQVNLAYDVRCELEYLLKTNENISKFQSFNDFLTVFDGAMGNTALLLSSVYGFRFHSYLSKQQHL